MAITKRNYIPGDFESFTNEPVGTPVLSTYYRFELDGLFGYAVADVALFQGGSEVPDTAYELIENETYTSKEAAESGLKIYKGFRITNASYAGIVTVATGKNFGSEVDNELLYTLYEQALVYNRTDYTASDSFTTSTTLYKSIHVFDSLTADATFTITDGGGDERNRFTVINNDPTYKVIVEDGTEGEPYWLTPGQTAEFYDMDDSLTWASAGWETVYDVPGNAGAVDESDLSRGTGAVKTGDLYKVTSLATQYISADIYIHDVDTDCRSTAAVYVAASNYYWDESAEQFTNDSATYRAIKKIQVYHNAA